MKKFIIPIIIILCIMGVFIGYINIHSIQGSQNKQNFSVETSPQNASIIVIGASHIKVPDNAKVVTQVDRVIKDTASNINDNTLTRTKSQLTLSTCTLHGRSQSSTAYEICYMFRLYQLQGCQLRILMETGMVPTNTVISDSLLTLVKLDHYFQLIPGVS